MALPEIDRAPEKIQAGRAVRAGLGAALIAVGVVTVARVGVGVVAYA